MRQSQILHVCFQSVKALYIWSWIPDTVAQNMAAAHANRGIFCTWKHCEELYKEKYGDFPNPVKNCPFAPQESICSHVSKSGV